MQIICTLLQPDNHASTLSLNLYFTGQMLFLMSNQQYQSTEGNTTTTPQPFYGPFFRDHPDENFWTMMQGEINRGRHTDHLAGCHSIRTNQCPPPPSPIFFTGRMPFLSPNQLSKYWRQLAQQGNKKVVLLRYPKPTPKPRFFAKTVHRRNLGFSAIIDGFLGLSAC